MSGFFQALKESLVGHEAEVPSKTLQLGLNFADKMPEFFAGKEMGKDALRVLNDYLKLNARVRADIAAELPVLRAALKLGRMAAK